MFKFLLSPLSAINTVALKIGSAVAIFSIAAMVVAILVQVFFRYVIGNALPWPDEFATAYRQGGFVAIDMLSEVLGKRASAALSLLLLIISLLVLVFGVKLGYKHVNSGWLFAFTRYTYFW